MSFNRWANSRDEFQGLFKKVLCVCSAGLLRSPTAAVILASEPFNFNTRAVGISKEYALIPIDEVLVNWADEIICMEQEHMIEIKKIFGNKIRKIICLDICDSFPYRDDTLCMLVAEKYKAQIIDP